MILRGKSTDTYGPVRAPPHLLQFEFLHTILVWCDRSTFDSDAVFEDGVGGIDSDLVICL
jgi:hypothetical protein